MNQQCLPGFDRHRIDIRLSGRITVADIQLVVANFYRIPIMEMKSARRSRNLAHPRQVAMYLARELTPQSFPGIGRCFGDRDHATVIHAVKQVEKRCECNSVIRQDVERMRDQLR